jgi:hypothetical protein
MLKNVRISFPELFVPKAPKGSLIPKYGAHFIFDKDSDTHKAVLAAIEEVAAAKWESKAASILKTMRLGDPTKFCLRDGDMMDREAYNGRMFVNASNKNRPTVVDRAKQPLTAASGVLYGGCYVNAQVDIYAMKHETGGYQVNASLMGVQFVRDGDSFTGGRPSKADDFDDLAVADDDEI